jgi:NAD(P)-dependent dehydrogenase (short-subunit alcohol dehydrogenase family)
MGSLTLSEPFSAFPLPAYKVSKAALNALTVQWAHALSAEKFVVASINPGVSIYFTVLSIFANDFGIDSKDGNGRWRWS